MEALQKEQLSDKRPTWHNVEISGEWELLYKTTNQMGPQAFGGKHLGVFENPFTKEPTYLKGPGGQPKSGYMIDKVHKKLFPDNDPTVKNLISWMICHPEVTVQGIKDLHPTILASKTPGKVFLICKDYVEMNEIEEEDFIDRLNGQISLDGGKNAIGLEKLRYILAAVGQSYMEPRFSGVQEKKFLRKKLKTFVRSSYDNAKKVAKAINDIEYSKDYFEFKEMVRNKIVIYSNGLYKFNDVPLGADYPQVQAFFERHEDVKLECVKQLYQIIDN